MAKEVTIYIDDIEVRTTVGKTVLEAAIDAGIYIPYLCYHQGMKPFAACRMCVVNVEGGRGNPASCTLPVSEGMVVSNSSSQIYELRRGIMEMLLAEHPHGCLTCHRVDLCGPSDICLRHVSVNDRCVTCPKNERCELKDTVRYLGMDLESPLEYKYRGLQVEIGDPFYDRDYNLCIVCGRCVRACEELRGDNAITFIERAGQTLIGTSNGTSLLESGCEFCGACLDVCPVGALVESDHKWEKPKQVERSICPQCPVGCQMNLEINRFGKVIRVVPEINSPVNKGQACFKGKFGLDFVNREERLTKPLIRRNGDLEEASWEEAIGLIAETFKQYQQNNFAFLTAGDGTNEDNYLAQKFTRVVMKTNNIDQTANTKPELMDALGFSLGYRSGTNPIWDLEGSKVILAFSTNLTEEQNVIGVPIKKAVKSGSKLIVIDPREVELTRYADVWLRPKPGTENLVLAAIMKQIVIQGFERREWINDNCDGLEGLRKKLEALDFQDVIQETGVPLELIENTASIYGLSDLASIVYGLDTIPKELREECVYSLAGLALLTGNLGRPSSGIYPMLRRAN
ncbi:4Fe-4S dicluster domain-containing protein [SAR202 cluster bacterium AC-409-J13_OGT_754m]|nr:4Fe-4S dicluster domain-containing protein [SAR202 cluster bacterium AC-409-J13_OGT_754m]